MLFDLLSPPAAAAASCATSAAAAAVAAATDDDDDDADANADAEAPSFLIVDEAQYARTMDGANLPPPLKPSMADPAPKGVDTPWSPAAPADSMAAVSDDRAEALSTLLGEWARPALIVTTPLCFLAAVAPLAVVLAASVVARRRSREPRRAGAGLL